MEKRNAVISATQRTHPAEIPILIEWWELVKVKISSVIFSSFKETRCSALSIDFLVAYVAEEKGTVFRLKSISG